MVVLNISASSTKVDWPVGWLSRIFLLHYPRSIGHSGDCPEYFCFIIQSRLAIRMVVPNISASLSKVDWSFVRASRIFLLHHPNSIGHSGGCPEYFCFINQILLASRVVVLKISAPSTKVGWPFGWLSRIFLLHHPKSIGYLGGCPQYFCFIIQSRLAIRVVVPNISALSSKVDWPFGWLS